MKVELGDEVKDTVTGFQGVVVAKHLYLQGCARFSVQPKVDNDGKHLDSVGFDEMQLEVIKKNVVPVQAPVYTRHDAPAPAQARGGPEKYADSGKIHGE